jgi:DNA polymerase III subunit chi
METHFRNLAGRPLELWVALLAAEHHAAGARVIVRAASPERVRTLDQALWTYDAGSFLPHGTAEGGRADRQPVFLTDGDDNPNGASALVLVDNSAAPTSGEFTVVDYVFERADPTAREAARQQWRLWKEQGHDPIYWEATAEGWRRAR